LSVEALPHQIAMLQYHRSYPIGKMDKTEAKRKFYEKMLVVVEVYFGADKNTPDSVFNECFNLMLLQHPNISLEEIREAHAEASKNALKAFGGIYTVNMFNEIMHAWKQKRNKLIAAIDAIENNAEKQEKDYTEKKRKEFSKYCKDWLTNELLNPTLKHWSELSLGICTELIQQGTVKGNRGDLWNLAKIEAVKQLTVERDDAMYNRGDYSKAKAYQSILDKVRDNNYPPDLKGLSEAIYTRLLVWDCIESNKNL
jgi:hypothetical protein